MLSEVTLHLFMMSRGIGINLNLLEINLVNTLILDVGLFYVLGDVLGGLLNDRLRALLSELFQRKERYLTSFYKLVRAGKVVSFSCVESWRIVYGESVMRMAAKTKILATSQLLKEFKPHVKTVSPILKTFISSLPVCSLDQAGTVRRGSYPQEHDRETISDITGLGPLSPYSFGEQFIKVSQGGPRTGIIVPGTSLPPYLTFIETENIPDYRGNVFRLPEVRPLFICGCGTSASTQIVRGFSRKLILYCLTKSAEHQVEQMPAYKVVAMTDDSKRALKKEYCSYMAKKYDRSFLQMVVGTTMSFRDIVDRTPLEDRIREAFYAMALIRRTLFCPWRRFIRPEWAMSIVANGSTELAEIFPVTVAHPSSTSGAPLAGEGDRDLTVLFTWPQSVRYFGGDRFPSQLLRYTPTHFFLKDGRVHKYFSGRMLSLVVSSLSQFS